MRKNGILIRASWLLASLCLMVCLLILSACGPSSVDVTRKTLQETYEIYYRYEDGNHCRVMHPGREMETVFPWPCVPQEQIDNSLPFSLEILDDGYALEEHPGFVCYTHTGEETDGYPLLCFRLTNESSEPFRYYGSALLEQKIQGQWYRCYNLRSGVNASYDLLAPGESVNAEKDLTHVVEPQGPDYSVGMYKVKEFAPGTYRLLVEVNANQYISQEFVYP